MVPSFPLGCHLLGEAMAEAWAVGLGKTLRISDHCLLRVPPHREGPLEKGLARVGLPKKLRAEGC